MKKDLLELIYQSDFVKALKGKGKNFHVDDYAGICLTFASLFNKNKGKYLLVCPNLYNAQNIVNFLSSLIGEENVVLYPSDDLLRSEYVSSSKEILSQKMFALNKMINDDHYIVVAHASSLIYPIISKKEFSENSIKLRVGNQYKISDIISIFEKAGYYRVNKIDQSFQYALRGDILDIFPINYDYPIRIEFFDDEIECIHYFDIASQLSNTPLDEVDISPSTDMLFSDDELDSFKERAIAQLKLDESVLSSDDKIELEGNVLQDIDDILSRKITSRTYKYFRYIKNCSKNIFDYVDFDITFIVNKTQFDASFDLLYKEAREYLYQLRENNKIISHLEMYLDQKEIFNNAKNIKYGYVLESLDMPSFIVHPLLTNKDIINNVKSTLKHYYDSSNKLLISYANNLQKETIQNALEDLNIDYKEITGLFLTDDKCLLSDCFINEGFVLPSFGLTVLTSKELFNYQNKPSRYFSKFKEATILKNYEELKRGDFVVHEQYGIGKFIEVITREIDGIHRDFLHIEYAKGDKLDVPLNQFKLVRKYAGREGAEPRLSTLSGSSWEKTKKRIKERVNELADRLYNLYSERAKIKGFAFQKDDEFQTRFENEFPFALTADQEKALQEIKADMESNYAMDRLLCGDVGFGKTEVAFRAAFKAILSGKQVAILCPTTLLSRQHFELAVRRFANFDVKIAQISRLVSESVIKDNIKRIRSGEIHLIIGTHALLANNFAFNDLGLLIVDEEQRFGVEQKEKIKEIKNNIDVLSLSATPIPRTLQLSLVGVRPISEITTPPINRAPIQTYVMPYKDEVIKELIERELSRNGQVFYLYNRVASIYEKAAHLKKKIPSALVGVVHGQMEKNEIEDVMMHFYNGDINVLVATSIIENGIDVPNANLIIVEDADRFGLSQLYQIKGRVGRGDRVAYAYLLFKESKMLNEVATKRLKAIQEFTELGSGYKIAQRDLLIRGAGDILGPEQAGFIDSIGLDLYLKMLNEVMIEKKTGQKIEPPKPVKLLHLDAYIPGEYSSEEEKIELYQKIENVKNENELIELRKEVRDIYGKLPDSVALLFRKRNIDIVLEKDCFDDIEEIGEYLKITLSKKFSSINGIGNKLFDALKGMLDKINVSYISHILSIKIKKEGDYLTYLEAITDIISTLYEEAKK